MLLMYVGNKIIDKSVDSCVGKTVKKYGKQSAKIVLQSIGKTALFLEQQI